jgi:hypothetical protein
MTPNERQARALTFRAALEDGVLRETLDAIEEQFTKEWKVAASTDERENLWRSIRIIGLMRSHMASIAAGEHDGISAIRRIK